MQVITDTLISAIEKNNLPVPPAPASESIGAKVVHTPEYRCKKCEDLGMVLLDVPYGHEQFGRAVRCDCNNPDNSERMLRHSGLTKTEQGFSLDWPETKRRNAKALKAVRLCLNSRPMSGQVLLWGHYGVGKSGLLKAAVAACCKRGIEATYITAPQLLNQLRDCYAINAPTEPIMKRYLECRVLAFDEIDKIKMSDWTFEQLNLLLDYRHRNIDTCVTLVATNLVPETSQDGISIFRKKHPDFGYLDDRLADAVVVGMGGDSLRGNKF